VDPELAPGEPERVTISFSRGLPEAVDGQRLSPARLIERLNEIGGRHGVGRADIVENRLVGIKSRGVYETPGGTILVAALRALEALTLDRDTSHEKERLAVRYAELVYFGQWFTPLREGLDAFFSSVMDGVTGSVTLKLYRGSAAVCGRRAENSLYDAGLASFDMSGYTAQDAEGFIRLFGLQNRGRRRLSPRAVEAAEPAVVRSR
jgi:argininosuccinate synthase